MLDHKKISRIFSLFGVAAALLCPGFYTYAYDTSSSGGVDGPGSIAVIYGAVALISLVIFIFYVSKNQTRNRYFALLYICVALANIGYFLLSISGSLPMALWANRISYFGCAFSVLLMLLIIAQVCGFSFSRLQLCVLIAISSAAFLLASTGGWLDIYYLSVELERVNGVSRLVKDYAPMHLLYPIYILCYFAVMLGIIIFARKMKKKFSAKYAFFLSVVVFGNIGVWGVEQLINIDFEFLSISFIATELLLLLMNYMLTDMEVGKLEQEQSSAHSENAEITPEMEAWFNEFSQRAASLTPTENSILQLFIEGCGLEEIAEKNYISVNTVKKHRTNIYRKLEIHSREELDLLIDMFRRADRLKDIMK